MDQVKNIRSQDVGITSKITSLEWFARYSEYITPDTLVMGVKAFKEIYGGNDPTEMNTYMAHLHHQEAIPTCV